jgi:hypothetical protein
MDGSLWSLFGASRPARERENRSAGSRGGVLGFVRGCLEAIGRERYRSRTESVTPGRDPAEVVPATPAA